ncbi:MAG: 50S ribosomal protein L5 [Minisyncoccales bacterium]
MAYLLEKYKKEAVPAMMKQFGYRNEMEVPKIEKVVVNCGFGRLVSGKTKDEQKKIQEAVARDLTQICGQKAMVTQAKNSISSFKIREGQNIGAKSTLRRNKMYDFLERVITVALPRSRDFQGIPPKGIDQAGNLTFGIKEHIAFPEISPEKINFIFSFEITVVTTAETKEEGAALFKLLKFPIRES